MCGRAGPDLREASPEHCPSRSAQHTITRRCGSRSRLPRRATKDIIQASSQAEKVKYSRYGLEDWWTPPAVLEAARVNECGIDLDPCSSPAANEAVQAARMAFTEADDGLVSRPWHGLKKGYG